MSDQDPGDEDSEIAKRYPEGFKVMFRDIGCVPASGETVVVERSAAEDPWTLQDKDPWTTVCAGCGYLWKHCEC